MKSQMIEGCTRVCGKGQGYLGLAIRDEKVDDPVNGPGTPQMVTSWEVFPDEMERLRAGAPVILSILGTTPPPLLLGVGRAPDEREAKDQTALHNIIAGRIVASIVRPVLQTGGTPAQVLVVLESVITGVVLALAKLGSDEKVLDTLMEGVSAAALQSNASAESNRQERHDCWPRDQGARREDRGLVLEEEGRAWFGNLGESLHDRWQSRSLS